MKKTFFSLLFALFCFGAANSQTADSDYKALLLKMMQVNGSEASYKAVIGQMTDYFKKSKTEVPDEFWQEMEQEMSKTSLDDLVELTAPIYAKHLSKEDLTKIIEFYQTPVGKKFAEKTPLITQESMQAGQEWGRELGEKIVKKLEEKGY